MDLAEWRAVAAPVRHPWERARRRLVSGVLEDALGPRDGGGLAALDVGSGDAWLSGKIAEDLGLDHVTAFDIGYTDDDCRALRTAVVQPALDWPDQRYDLVLLLDVIEHVADDVDLLRRAREHLGDSGTLMVTVPAWPSFATAHDAALGHHRRYTPASLRAALASAGLRERRLGGAFASLLPLRKAQRVLERVRGPKPQAGVSGWTGGPLTTRVLAAALAGDARCGAWLAERNRLLPGLSLWAIAVSDA